MAITGVNHITLAVADLPRSVSFYTEILGGQLYADWDRGAYLELGSLWLCLTQSDAPIAPRTDYTHLALSCPDSEFAALSQTIRANADLWQANQSEGLSLYFLDPDGHRLELHQGDLSSRLDHYRTHPEKGVQLYD